MPGFDKVALMKYPQSRTDQPHPPRRQTQRASSMSAAAVLVAEASARRTGLKPAPASAPPRRSAHDPTIKLNPRARRGEDPSGRRHVDFRHRPLRGERGLLLGGAPLHAGPSASITEAPTVNGGSPSPWATPWARRGAIIIGHAPAEMERTGRETGLATLCVASGHGGREPFMRSGVMTGHARQDCQFRLPYSLPGRFANRLSGPVTRTCADMTEFTMTTDADASRTIVWDTSGEVDEQDVDQRFRASSTPYRRPRLFPDDERSKGR